MKLFIVKPAAAGFEKRPLIQPGFVSEIFLVEVVFDCIFPARSAPRNVPSVLVTRSVADEVRLGSQT